MTIRSVKMRISNVTRMHGRSLNWTQQSVSSIERAIRPLLHIYNQLRLSGRALIALCNDINRWGDIKDGENI